MTSAYFQLLKDPRWQKKRLEIMERDGFKCAECGNSEIELQIHHNIYVKDADPWDLEDEYLTCLCKDCHEKATHFAKFMSKVVRATSRSKVSRNSLTSYFTDGKYKSWDLFFKDVLGNCKQ